MPAVASAKAGGRDRFDTAIDLAVREMLDVEPAADLRARILTRIDALSTDSVASAFRRKILWIAAPVAAAALIVLAVLTPWRHAATPAPPQLMAQAPAVPFAVESPNASGPSTTTVIDLPYAMPPSRPRRTPPPGPRGVDDRLVVPVVIPADDSSGIDPLTPIAPIVVAGTQPVEIVPKDIAISPMAPIAPLQIAPLSPPERRN